MELYAGLSSAESRSRERSASTGVAKAATANTTASPRNRFVICPLRYARCRTTYEFIPVANQARQVRRRGGHTPKERARLTWGRLGSDSRADVGGPARCFLGAAAFNTREYEGERQRTRGARHPELGSRLSF